MIKNIKFILSLAVICQFILSCASNVPNQNVQTETTDDQLITDGYSQSRAKNKTGATSYVEHPTTIITLDNYLRGLSGVNVLGNGANATIRVRGVSSFDANASEPLFVLNGSPLQSYSDAYNSINPAEIKRVTVLTDAASTGLYGSRAANGVIVITLKESK